MESPIRTDFLVLGSGIAGLWFALNSARFGKVLVLTKKGDTDSNTNYAQGGIAAAFGITDSPELHCLDTMKAGEGLCREEVVRAVVSEGPRLVETLNSMGVEFTTYQDGRGQTHFDLGREGGHRRARIVHAHDYTGREVESSLVGAVRNHPRVTILQNHFAVDLIIDTSGFCRGCQAINESTNALQVVLANVTLLATGGIGQVYQYTTNPRIATGDGIAMAFRAGARIANMEFIQFHPTALYGHTIEGRAFLISEALRGEGAVLKTQDGMTFMERYHELGSLAPRDVVARAANAEMKRRGDRYVLLDATHLDPGRLEQRFPNIFSQCLKFGIDIRREPIPVVPAAPYVCGGVDASLDGETSVPGLFAAGECACTGLHGANRLASNSLLEALVIADRAARRAAEVVKTPRDAQDQALVVPDIPPRRELASTQSAERIIDQIRSVMWSHAAIVRSDAGLATAWNELERIRAELAAVLQTARADIRLLEARNMLIVARLIVWSARQRRESRGLHFNQDMPNRDDAHFARDTIVTRDELGI